MGREVRRVPADWKHPIDEVRGRFRPLLPGEDYAPFAAEFMERATTRGLQDAVDFFGQAPDMNDYMPDWPDDRRTHFMMYEDTTPGTPISPAFGTPEELARWLADTNASAFGGEGATYEAWLAVAKGKWAPSMVFSLGGGLQSGVTAMLGVDRDS